MHVCRCYIIRETIYFRLCNVNLTQINLSDIHKVNTSKTTLIVVLNVAMGKTAYQWKKILTFFTVWINLIFKIMNDSKHKKQVSHSVYSKMNTHIPQTNAISSSWEFSCSHYVSIPRCYELKKDTTDCFSSMLALVWGAMPTSPLKIAIQSHLFTDKLLKN